MSIHSGLKRVLYKSQRRRLEDRGESTYTNIYTHTHTLASIHTEGHFSWVCTLACYFVSTL